MSNHIEAERQSDLGIEKRVNVGTAECLLADARGTCSSDKELVTDARSDNLPSLEIENKPPLEEVIDKNIGGFFSRTNKPNIIAAIANMSPEDAAKYQNDSTYRGEILELVRGALGDGQYFELADDLLRNVEKTGKVELSDYDKVRVGALTGTAGLDETAKNIKTLLANDSSAIERVNNPQSEDDRAFKRNIEYSIRAAVNLDQTLNPTTLMSLFGIQKQDYSYQIHNRVANDLFGTNNPWWKERLPR